MSNHLAIAAVTAALGRLIQDGLDRDVPGATVSFDRPGGQGDANRRGVTLFLFQLTPNPHLRNLDLPLRDGEARRRSRASAAYDLHYLISAYGTAATFEPERVLGSVVRRLHEHAVLGRDLIRAALADPANAASLAGADLAEAPELVKLSPTPLSLEELSKLWSILFQTAYRPSIAYRATTVQIEAEREVGRAVPVRLPRGWVVPMAEASVESVRAADGPQAPIVWGGRVVLSGRGFRLPGATILIGGAPAEPETVTDGSAEIVLAPASLGGRTLRAGIGTAAIRLPAPPDSPPALARQSAPCPFLLRPRLAIPPGAIAAGPPDGEGRRDGTIAVDLSPPLAEGQRARLRLDRVSPRPPLSVVLAPAFDSTPSYPLTRVPFGFAGLPAGTWLVRGEVDGAESPLETVTDPEDPAFGTVVGPTVSLP